ncbi:IS66 family transposase, partial [Dysosmobacter welbionis]
HATQQGADVVAGLSVVQQLVEHLDAGDNGLLLLVGQANNLDFLAQLQDTTLHTAGSHGAAAGDGEHVLDGHQERHILLAVGGGDIVVNSIHQLLDAGILGSGGIAGLGNQSVQSGTLDDGDVVAGELILGEQLTDLHLHQLQQLGVVDLIALVQEHDDGGHAHLTGQQDVLTSLSHGAVGSGDNQDSTVHLGSAGNHVLDIVGVARAVHVGIVTLLGLILHVSGVDGNAALLLLGGLVDGVISLELSLALQRQPLGNGGGQRGLAMVDVTNGADVNMGLGSFKFLLSHLKILLSIFKICWVQCGFSQHCLFYRIMEGKSIPFSLRLG